MLTAILSGPTNPISGTSRSSASSNAIQFKPITPPQYLELLGKIYEENFDKIQHSDGRDIYLGSANDDTHLNATFVFDVDHLSANDILKHVSDTCRGSFFPSYVGIAYPCSQDLIRDIHRELKDGKSKLKIPGITRGGIRYAVEDCAATFKSAEVRQAVKFAYMLRCIVKSPEHANTSQMLLIGVDISHTNFEDMDPSKMPIVDETIGVDPHIFVLHPDAVSWF